MVLRFFLAYVFSCWDGTRKSENNHFQTFRGISSLMGCLGEFSADPRILKTLLEIFDSFGGALNPYILNQDIPKWHFSAHGARLDGAFSV